MKDIRYAGNTQKEIDSYPDPVRERINFELVALADTQQPTLDAVADRYHVQHRHTNWRDLLAPWTICYAFMRVVINGATAAAIVWLAVTQSTLLATMSVLIGAASGWVLTHKAPARRDWPGLALLAIGEIPLSHCFNPLWVHPWTCVRCQPRQCCGRYLSSGSPVSPFWFFRDFPNSSSASAPSTGFMRWIRSTKSPCNDRADLNLQDISHV